MQDGTGRGRRRREAWVLGLLAVCAACAERGAQEPLELERLAWVSRGTTLLGRRQPVGSAADLLVDRHELTRAQWRRWAPRAGLPRVPAPELDPWRENTRSWPATGMDLAEARALAAARGMRLPSVHEWLWIASGFRGQAFPYGTSPMVSAANTAELGLGRPAPVGTFVAGRTPSAAVYDLLGNVWEWTEPPPPAGGAPPVGATVRGLDAWAMGGSYLEPIRPMFGSGQDNYVNAQELEPGHRAVDLGMRCVVEAEEYLWPAARAVSDTRWRARLVALGESWGRTAVPTLERLASRAGAPRALAWLLEGARR